MYCPKCGAEYIPGIETCADCGVPLQADPPRPESEPEPELELTPIAETGDAIRTALVTSLLDDAGIPYMIRNEQLQDLFGMGRLVPVNPVSGPVVFLVPADRTDEARDLLAAHGFDPV